MNKGHDKRKVTVVIPIINQSWHGGTRVLIELAKSLSARGHRAIIVTSRGRRSTPYTLNSIEVREIGVKTRSKHLDYLIFLALLAIRPPRADFYFATFFVTYLPVRLAAILRRAEYAYFVQDIESKYTGVAGMVLNAVCSWSYRDRRIIAANPWLSRELSTRYVQPCASVSIGPSEAFYRIAVEDASPDFDIVYFARREPWKGLDRFLSFLEQSGDRFRALIVSQDTGLLESLAGPNRVCVRPSCDEELVGYLDRGKVFLFTSRKEGFGLPPLEAMARGLAVVLFPSDGPQQYCDDGANCLLVRSVQEMVDKVQLVLNDVDLRMRLGDAGRRTATAYNLSAAMDVLVDYVEGHDRKPSKGA